MPATSYTELFNFEGNFESAFKKWLAAQMIEVQAQMSIETLPDDYIGVTMKAGGITGHYNISPGGSANPTYDQYELTWNLLFKHAGTMKKAAKRLMFLQGIGKLWH